MDQNAASRLVGEVERFLFNKATNMKKRQGSGPIGFTLLGVYITRSGIHILAHRSDCFYAKSHFFRPLNVAEAHNLIDGSAWLRQVGEHFRAKGGRDFVFKSLQVTPKGECFIRCGRFRRPIKLSSDLLAALQGKASLSNDSGGLISPGKVLDVYMGSGTFNTVGDDSEEGVDYNFPASIYKGQTIEVGSTDWTGDVSDNLDDDD